jgi:hypothetical protein
MTDETPKPRFLSSLNELKKRNDDSWEHRVVSRLLTFFSSAWRKRELIEYSEERYGEPRLTLEAFHTVFPELPFYLVAHALYKVEEDVSVARLMTKFEKTRLAKVYDEFVDYIPDDIGDSKAYGLVIKWPYVKNGFILHDMGISAHGTGTRLLVCSETRVLVLESFDSFLESNFSEPS